MTATGCYTDPGGVCRCRATSKRCLSHRQAAELANGARRRGELGAQAYHCKRCGTWHYGHQPVTARGRKPRRRWARKQRSW